MPGTKKESGQQSDSSTRYTNHYRFLNGQLRRLDLNLMLIFAAIGRHRRFSAAAEELCLTKSAVSHAVNRLRDIFNDPLFIRRQSGVELTPSAATLLPKILAVIELSNDVLMLERSFDAATDERELRIGAVEYAISIFGPELARICEREAPAMRLRFVSTRRTEIIELINSCRVDLGIGSFRGNLDRIHVEHLYLDRYVVACRRGSRWTDAPLTAQRYLEAGHIGISNENEPQSAIESLMTQLGESRRQTVLLPHYMAALDAAGPTDLLLTIPERMAAEVQAYFGLQLLPFPFGAEVQTISMLSQELACHDPALRWLQEKLRCIAGRWNAEPGS